jgi:DNA-binding MarR family transcriptional regulator
MKNKKELQKAIKEMEKYSLGHRSVANILIELESEYQTTASVQYLMDKTGFTKPTVYAALRVLQKDNMFSKSHDFTNTYTFNKERIAQIIEQFEHKIAIPNAS